MTLIYSSVIATPKESSKAPPQLIHHNVVHWNGNIYIFNGKIVDGKTLKKKPAQIEKYMYKYPYEQNLSALKENPFLLQTKEWMFCGTDNDLSPFPRYGASTILRENELYLFGGKNEFGEYLNDLWRFNFKTEIWDQITQTTGVIGPKAYHKAIYEPNQDVMYILFGRGKNGLSGEVYKYHFQSRSWKMEPTLGKRPSERKNFGICLFNKSIYIYGGKTSIGKDDGFFKLDLNTRLWSEINSIPPTKSLDNELFDTASIIDSVASNESVSDFYSQNYSNPGKSKLQSIINSNSFVSSPPKMQGLQLVTVRDQLILHGGSYSSHHIFVYSILNNTWNKVPIQGTKFFGREYHESTCINDGIIVFYGGVGEDLTQGLDKRYIFSKKLEEIKFYNFEHENKEDKFLKLSNMKTNEELIDLEVMTIGKTFLCHKVVLQRSSFLENLINDATKKQESKIINIKLKGVHSTVFQDFITWMYDYKLDKINSIIDLCKFAFECKIYDLVLYCAKKFQENLNSNTVIQMYIDTNIKNEIVLKHLCQKYTYENFTNVMSETQNVQLLSKVPNILQEIMLLSRDKMPNELDDQFPELKTASINGKLMFENYIKRYSKNNSGDLKISSNDSRQFFVHPPLVASFSPAILKELNTYEKSFLKINLRGQILEVLLEFIHTGNVSNASNFSIDLLIEIAQAAHEWFPIAEDLFIILLIERISRNSLVPLLQACRKLKSLKNTDVLKKYCQQELMQKFSIEELSEFVVNFI